MAENNVTFAWRKPGRMSRLAAPPQAITIMAVTVVRYATASYASMILSRLYRLVLIDLASKSPRSMSRTYRGISRIELVPPYWLEWWVLLPLVHWPTGNETFAWVGWP